ncbi:MAG TPA: glycosyltransferase [Candidatus Eisenbacteria bacterium]|jgi:processive 1,2-diacylglycerol beta-glucosyltransferase|nr:glycosyltransferase [Candidatus Eisenbacteria bacterium]
MDSRKKILILYASAGLGHERAAKALFEAFKGVPGVEARCEDVLRWAAPMFGRNYSAVYIFMIKHCPWLWGFFYYLTDIRILYRPLWLLRRVVNTIAARPLERLIELEAPSVIVSTHFLSTEVLAHLKRKSRVHAKLVTVITDFQPHAFWIAEGTDLYVAALPETALELERRGIPAERVKVLGIPIAAKFGRRHSKADLREKLGLDRERFTVLLTSGGAGVGKASRIIEKLLSLGKPIQAMIVCGTNRSLFFHLSSEAAARPGLKVFGFVENMEELMGAADLVVGKAGGLTMTECLASGTPMVVYEPVPGQEGRNATSLVRSGAGFLARSMDDAVNEVLSFFENPRELAALREKAHHLGRPAAARELVDWILHES